MSLQKTLSFRIIKYGIDHDTFTVNDLMTDLNLVSEDESFIVNNLLALSPSGITSNSIIATVLRNTAFKRDMKEREGLKAMKVRLLPNALFSYIDHEEIVLAKQAANEARRSAEKSIQLAWVAIWASIVIGVISVLLSGWQIYLQVKSSVPDIDL